MNIRPGTVKDAEAIAVLHASSGRDTYSAVLSQNYLQEVVPSERQTVWADRFAMPKRNQVVLVAEDSKDVVGFACLFVDEHQFLGSYIDNLQ